MYVLYVIPQYHVFIVYINPITTFILYIITFYSMVYEFDAIMFYCTLSEMTRIKMINQISILLEDPSEQLSLWLMHLTSGPCTDGIVVGCSRLNHIIHLVMYNRHPSSSVNLNIVSEIMEIRICVCGTNVLIKLRSFQYLKLSK